MKHQGIRPRFIYKITNWREVHRGARLPGVFIAKETRLGSRNSQHPTHPPPHTQTHTHNCGDYISKLPRSKLNIHELYTVYNRPHNSKPLGNQVHFGKSAGICEVQYVGQRNIKNIFYVPLAYILYLVNSCEFSNVSVCLRGDYFEFSGIVCN
jgi:hypothetical protein